VATSIGVAASNGVAAPIGVAAPNGVAAPKGGVYIPAPFDTVECLDSPVGCCSVARESGVASARLRLQNSPPQCYLL
jgi:hypothetical protein